jgi:hypothetical protein
VEPDNIDCYDNGGDCYKKISPTRTKKETVAQQLVWNRWQTEAAHSRGLAIAMKNAIDVVKDLHDCYDLAINEQCQTYDECGDLQTYFSDKGKSVLQVEYTGVKDSLYNIQCSEIFTLRIEKLHTEDLTPSH